MLELLTSPEAWISLATLSAMEIVLGIDNIVFLSILAGKLPVEQQPKARRLGLAFALVTRLGLLFAITWVMGLTAQLFAVAGHGFSGRDLILLGGGLFLIGKATIEIHDKLEVSHASELRTRMGNDWENGQGALFALLGRRYLTLTAADAATPDAWAGYLG
jgi:predicted tellurium resistance membrane protein TerC